jgi:hypothetical protein
MNKKYVSLLVKVQTHKNLKQLSLDLGLPLTQLIDLLLKEYQENRDAPKSPV